MIILTTKTASDKVEEAATRNNKYKDEEKQLKAKE